MIYRFTSLFTVWDLSNATTRHDNSFTITIIMIAIIIAIVAVVI